MNRGKALQNVTFWQKNRKKVIIREVVFDYTFLVSFISLAFFDFSKETEFFATTYYMPLKIIARKISLCVMVRKEAH